MFAAVAKKSKPSPPQIAAAFAGLNHLQAKCSSVKLLTANVTRLLANWHFVRDGMQVPDWDRKGPLAAQAALNKKVNCWDT